jgi:hypothetical protein
LITVPDAPVNLTDLPDVTSDSQVGFSWEDGASNGGTEIIDWRVFKSDDNVNFSVVVLGLTERQATITSLVGGQTYYFKVQARNEVDYGYESAVIAILAASVPAKADTPITVWSSSQNTITVTWNLPDDRGSALTHYTVFI